MEAQSAVSIEENGIKWGPIRLLAGVKSRNMTVYLLGAIFTMLFSTFVPQAQPFILTEILRIPGRAARTVKRVCWVWLRRLSV